MTDGKTDVRTEFDKLCAYDLSAESGALKFTAIKRTYRPFYFVRIRKASRKKKNLLLAFMPVFIFDYELPY